LVALAASLAGTLKRELGIARLTQAGVIVAD